MAVTRFEERAVAVKPIFDALKRQGKTQAWLAREIGIEPTHSIRWIRSGQKAAPEGFLAAAAEAMGMSPADIYEPRRQKSA